MCAGIGYYVMAAPKITYEGENGTKTYVGEFRYNAIGDGIEGFILIDRGEKNGQGEKTLTMIPRSRVYSIENIAYEDDRDRPTLNGTHQ